MITLVTLEEFVKQVKEIEGIEISIKKFNFGDVIGAIKNSISNNVDVVPMIPAYPYTDPFPGNLTVDDLKEQRLYPHLRKNNVCLLVTSNDDLLEGE